MEEIKIKLKSLDKEVFYFLFFSLMVSFPLYFYNAFEYSPPMGYAGMFAQMAEQIADANFILPQETPFYGPGGIPFAYPPLALYLLAIPIKLTGKYLFFLRWLPPLYTLLASIPLFFLIQEITKSPLSSAISTILVATSTELYIAHAWAAGIVRALAFIFALFSILFFIHYLKNRLRLNLILAGVFLGFVTLTHLEYAVFVVLCMGLWTLLEKPFLPTLKALISIYGIGFLIALLWIVPILTRYGYITFLNALNSHDNASVFFMLGDFRNLAYFIQTKFNIFGTNYLHAIFFVLGSIALLINKKSKIIILYILLTFIFPTEKFSTFFYLIIVGIGITFPVTFLNILFDTRKKPKFFYTLLTLSLLPVIGYFWMDSFTLRKKQSPKMDSQTIYLSEEIQNQTSPDEKYLALIQQDEAEWLPFFFQREPIVAQWGSEWIGNYAQETNRMTNFRHCQRKENWDCVQNLIITTKKEPHYIITYKESSQLNQDIKADNYWTEIYSNKRYILWQFQEKQN